MVPPSYEDAINEDETLGSGEDLAEAAKLVPHSRIYAALRTSEDSKDLTKVRDFVILFLIFEL